MFEYSSYKPNKKEKEELDVFLAFLSKLAKHNLELATNKSKAVNLAMVGLTLKRASKKEKLEIKKN